MNSDSGYSKIYLKQIDLAINPKISATEKLRNLRNPEIFSPFCLKIRTQVAMSDCEETEAFLSN